MVIKNIDINLTLELLNYSKMVEAGGDQRDESGKYT
jgi:hypothetical protein